MTAVLHAANEGSRSPPPRREVPRLFEHIEHALAIGIGVLLSVAAVLALTGAATLAWDGVIQWPQTRSLFGIVDRLLFVLMLVEILHTVPASIQPHRPAPEPLLFFRMITAPRRLLTLTPTPS